MLKQATTISSPDELLKYAVIAIGPVLITLIIVIIQGMIQRRRSRTKFEKELEGIRAEVEKKRLESIAQAERAASELKQYIERNAAQHDNSRQQMELQWQEFITNAARSTVEKDTKINNLYEQIVKITSDNAHLQHELNQFQSLADKISAKASDQETIINDQAAVIGTLKHDLDAQHTNFSDQIRAANEERDALRKRVEDLIRETEDLKESNQLQIDLLNQRILTLGRENETLRGQVTKLETENTRLNAELKSLQSTQEELETARRRAEKLDQENRKLADRMAALEQQQQQRLSTNGTHSEVVSGASPTT